MSALDLDQLPEPPGPETISAAEVTEENPLHLLMNLRARYGELVCCPNKYGRSYLFDHPKLVHHFLHSGNYERTKLLQIALGQGSLSTDGPVWKRQRRIVNPAFQPARVRALVDMMAEGAAQAVDGWLEAGTETIDMDEEMMRLTLTIVVRALFSTDVGDDVHEVSRALTDLITDLGVLTSTLFGVPVTFDPDRNRRLKAALSTMDAIVYRIIDARREAPGSRGDLLDLLLLAEDPETGERLEDDRLRDEAVTMLQAGHETTAIALTWAWHLLSEHPEVEARLHAEVDALEGRRPTVEDLPRLRWTECILQEALRLYPPVWAIARRVKEDEEVGGYRIRGDSAAFICPYILHRHPEYWQDPERFDPGRFEPGRFEKIERYAFVPFARGPHMCAGHHFAVQEGVLILATLAQRFRFERIAEAPPEPLPLISLRVKGGLPMRLEAR